MRTSRGYTIVEVVIVMCIIGILAAGSIIFIGFFQGMKLQSAAEKLAYDIKYAQNLAMSKTLWHGVSFEVDPINIYCIYQTNGTSDILEVDPADFSKNLAVNLNEKFGVVIKTVSLEGGQNKVEFNGLGTPYTDYNGWIVSREGTVVLGVGNMEKAITITPNTGKVAIQ